MLTLATNETEKLLDAIAALIDKACDDGDNISAIAVRAGIPRSKISKIRNKSFTEYPTIDTLSKIADALGQKVRIVLLHK